MLVYHRLLRKWKKNEVFSRFSARIIFNLHFAQFVVEEGRWAVPNQFYQVRLTSCQSHRLIYNRSNFNWINTMYKCILYKWVIDFVWPVNAILMVIGDVVVKLISCLCNKSILLHFSMISNHMIRVDRYILSHSSIYINKNLHVNKFEKNYHVHNTARLTRIEHDFFIKFVFFLLSCPESVRNKLATQNSFRLLTRKTFELYSSEDGVVSMHIPKLCKSEFRNVKFNSA